MRWILALLVVGLTALPAPAQVRCMTHRAGGFLITDCDDTALPAPRPADLSGGIVTPESIGAWRALEAQRLRIEEQRLRNEILRRQLERAAEPPSTSLRTLAFTSGLAGVDVWLDGQWRGRTVAGQRLVVAALSPGQHWIEVRVADRLWSGAITVEANERSVIDLDSLVSATPLGPTTNSPPPAPRTAPPTDRKSEVMVCRSEATTVAGTADETDVWQRAFQVCVKRAGLVPLTPEQSARVRALLACKAEVGAVADETARTQRIRQCMASQGYLPTGR